jgi:glycerate-2-kinase
MQVRTFIDLGKEKLMRFSTDQETEGYLINRAEISDHGNKALREVAAQIIESALDAADPYTQIKTKTSLKGDVFKVDEFVIDLKKYNKIYFLGAGKATQRIAKAIDELLGDRITKGVVVLKHGSSVQLKHMDVFYGAHPVPDENGYRGAEAIMSLVKKCAPNDLVIAGFSGGSSALLPFPVKGVSLQEKQIVHHVLLHCGADITEINTVRKHLSRIKGGNLAKLILPATILNITVSDVIGDPLDYITDPTVPDTSTFGDARQVLTKFDIWEQIPVNAREYLENGDASKETPKDFGDAKIFTWLAVDSSAACVAAARQAEKLGYKSMILTTMLKGEAKECGLLFSSIAQEISKFDRPLSPPCAILAAGENTVTIRDNPGEGGPNQTFALAAALDISNLDNVVITAIDTDGTDGPTEYAGGIVDSSTIARAKQCRLDIDKAIKDHNVSHVLKELNDLILTGHTGTNVNDLKLMLIS